MKKSLFLLITFFSCIASGFVYAENEKAGFIENRGQVMDAAGNFHPEVKYYYGTNGNVMYFEPGRVVCVFSEKETFDFSAYTGNQRAIDSINGTLGKNIQRIDIDFIGANEGAEIIPGNTVRFYTNFFLNSRENITGVKSFGSVTYKNIYKNTDIVFYYHQGGIKYDVILHEGAKIEEVKIRYNGASEINLTENRLVIKTKFKDIIEEMPLAYYDGNPADAADVRYNVNGNVIGFSIEDKTYHSVTIDPVLVWATFFETATSGGNLDYDHNLADADGNLFIYGRCDNSANNYPLVNPGGTAYQQAATSNDIYIAKFSSSRSLVWATYFGGNTALDWSLGTEVMAVTGDVLHIVGDQMASNAPRLNGGGFYYTIANDRPFYLRFNKNSGELLHSCNMGGGYYHSIAASNTGKIAIVYHAYDFNTVHVMNRAGAYNQATNGGFTDMFLMLLNNTYTQTWGTWLGGPGTQEDCHVTFDNSENIFFVSEVQWLTGSTATTEKLQNPGSGAYYQSTNASEDIMIGKFTSAGVLSWNTLYGGNAYDGIKSRMGNGTRVMIHPTTQELVVIGGTNSNNLPLLTLSGAYNITCPSNINSSGSSFTDFGSFILKFSNSGVRNWSTYWGGDPSDGDLLYNAKFVACDKFILCARAYYTPISYPGYYNQPTGQQSFLMQMDNNFAAEWSSYIGINTSVPKISYTPYQTRLYLTTQTYSQAETTLNPGGGAYFDDSFTGPHYASYYITEFSISAAPPAVSGPTLVCGGQTGVTYNVPAVSGATYTWTVPAGATITSGQGTNSITVTFGNNGGDVCLTLSGSCVQSTPTCLTVSLDMPSVEPTSVSATPATICENSSTTLTLNGGSLGTGASWHWYSGSCGGTSAGSGNSITVTPTTTTTYYVQAIGTCNTTPCQSVQITVVPMPDPGTDGALTVCSSDAPVNLFNALGGTPDAGGIWENPSSVQVTQPVDPATAESGSYLYIVSGSDPCGPDTAIVILTVNDAPKLDSISVAENTMCSPPYNGEAEFHVSGAGGNYDFVVDGGSTQSSSVFSNLSAGNHTYSITGTNGCSITGDFTIGSSTGFMIDSLLYSPVGCNGGTDGTLTIYANGAVSFSIDNGTTFGASSSFSGLGAGIYNVVVVDGGNCQASQTVTITEPAAITGDTTVVHALCGPTGSVTVTVSGGTSPYSYSWNNGVTTAANTGLAAGTYAVTITDANGCQYSIINIIVNDLGGSGSASVTDLHHISCFGASDGSITVAMPSGNPPITYEWSHNTGLNAPTASGLDQGQYDVTLTDSYGCSVVLNGTINEPPVLSGNYITSNVICYGTSTGGVDLTVTGGTSPYSYNWSNLIVTEDLTDVMAGYYSVTVTDSNGCTWSASNILVRDAAEIVASYIINDVLCYGSTTGNISASVIGGQVPYIYDWSNGGQTSNNPNLSAGIYFCTITDANGCINIDTIAVSQPDELLVNFSISHPQCHNSPTGQIAVIPVGGNIPYTYEWSHSVAVSDSLATGLLFGPYTVTVYDAYGCSVTGSPTVLNSETICLVIPDVFTPNGDGVNETFEILGIEAFPEAIMQIYNRWGDLLFKSTFYNDFWNGTWDGDPVPMGPYVFILDLRNDEKPIQGVVTVVY